MKTFIRAFSAALVFAAALTAPHRAFALRTFTAVSPSPASANVPAGIASTNTSTVGITNGSGASTRYIGPATITTSVSPADPTVSASVSPSTLTFPNANTGLTTTLTVTTTAATPVGAYVVSIIANTNPPHVNVTPVTNTYTLNVGAVFLPQLTWTPAGANTNWSTAANWSPTNVPTSSNDVTFVDLGADVPGTVNNVVDAGFTVGSLTYGHTNNAHTTLILPGATLTVGGSARGLVVGTGTDPVDGQLTAAAITGTGATLAFTNRNANVNVSQSHPTADNGVALSQATLDLSGLDKFTATAARLLVGADLSIKGASGVLKLARTNSLTLTAGSVAPQIDVGDNTQAAGSPAIPSILLLGETNAVFADSITVGRGKTDNTGASLAFNTGYTSPVAVFRGTNGAASRVGTWTIGDGFGSRTFLAAGTCDFSLGTVNALVGTLYVGKGASTAFGSGANDPGNGTLTLNAGIFDINTLEVGYTLTAAGNGTVNVSGGSLVVNSLLELAHGAGSSGTLNISGGVVTATPGIAAGAGSSAINMTGGVLSATNSSISIGTLASPISTLSLADSTINLPVRSIAATVVASTLTAGGAINTISVSAVPILTNTPAQFPVIRYTFSSGNLDTFALGTLPGTYQGFISNNAANASIDLVITNGPITPLLVWNGAPGGNWDTTTFNWKTNGAAAAFQQGYPVVQFDDSLTGTSIVNLTTALSVGSSLAVNNTLSNYVFTGAGSISGPVTLIKSGPGTLTLSETGGDNFTGGLSVNAGSVILDNANSAISGGTAINGGTVQVGNNSANGTLPSGGVGNEGILVFNRADSLVVSNPISGSGMLIQDNTNSTTLNGNSTFDGAAIVARGILQVGSSNGLGLATSVTISNGATFDVGGVALFGNGNAGLSVTVAGSGFGGIGAIVNSGVDQARVLHTVTMTADTAFGGDADWDIRNSTGAAAAADAQLNGAFNLTKVGTNALSFRGVTLDPALGNVNVQNGTVTITATATAPVASLGNPAATATVFSNATLTFDTIGSVPGKNIALNNGGTLKSAGTNSISSPVTLVGPNNTISVGAGAQLTITTAIGGVGGGLSKNGANTLFLTAANTYSGSTVVSGGTLALYGGGSDGSIGASTNINITSGATLDVSGRGDKTLTLVSGQTLSGGAGTNGSGNLTGILTVNSGATLAPGTGATNTGALNVSSNATLQGATQIKLNASNGSGDQLSAFAIAYGGTLTVTNVSGAVTNGQSFQLFAASGYSGTFAVTNLPPLPAGLGWSNTLALNGRLTVISTAAPLQPYLTGVTISGGNLIISGTNGSAGQPYAVLSSTNVGLSFSQWTSLVTNTFSGGSFSITNPMTPGISQRFYILRVP